MIDIRDFLLEVQLSGLLDAIDIQNPGLLDRAKNNPDFVLFDRSGIRRWGGGQPNKCEDNSFQCLLKSTTDALFPVVGYMFQYDSLTPIEHIWIYDESQDIHYEPSPVTGDIRAYAGIIERGCMDQVKRARDWYDVDCLKGGYAYFKYFG